ncbi:hypothetical protein IFR05_016354 [Cadophora sp. M221]|nr:hypothetical protein IFR05_016354 [Cadophora sp. M221]
MTMEIPYVGQKMREGGIEEKRRKEEIKQHVEEVRKSRWVITDDDEEEVKRAWEEVEEKERAEKAKAKKEKVAARHTKNKKRGAEKAKAEQKKYIFSNSKYLYNIYNIFLVLDPSDADKNSAPPTELA